MEIQGKQNSTVIPGNSQQHCQATREAFFRRVFLPVQAVDPAISSSKQHDCDDRQRRSICQGEVRATEAASTRDRSTPSPTSDPVNLDKQCYSTLRDELILKNFFMRLLYTQHPSQQQDHEDIPGNVFFEWLGKARISEKNLRNIQHFKALARFNGFNVKVLVDKPITIVAAEARTETVTGGIETITVARLYKDFRAALAEQDSRNVSLIFNEFVKRTEQHRVGLCTHALRSDYFRLALMYTYGGMHSDVAVLMEDFNKERGYVDAPLIPLKGKNGFLIRLFCHEGGRTSPDVPRRGSLRVKYFVDRAWTSNTLMASSKQNKIVLSMIYSMLVAERRLEIENMSETDGKKIGSKVHAIYDRDIMRLYQCSKEQKLRFFVNHKASLYIETSRKEAELFGCSEALLMEEARESFKKEFLGIFNAMISTGSGPDFRLLFAVTSIGVAGLSSFSNSHGPGRPYEDVYSNWVESSFPFLNKVPAIANMKSLHWTGDGSWYKGLSNPRYVEDIDVEYHECPGISRHDKGKAGYAPLMPAISPKQHHAGKPVSPPGYSRTWCSVL